MADHKETEVTTSDEFRAAIEDARVRANMSLRGLAAVSGATHATYWAWQRRRRASAGGVTLEQALAYAKALGLRLFLRRD